MTPVLLAGLLALMADPAPSALDLLFTQESKTTRLRVAVAVNGQNPEVAWSAFLDKLFDHFDRDRDGTLSETEANRVIALPLPGGRTIVPNWTKLDSDGDKKATRSEFREFYRRSGFAPVVGLSQSPSLESLRLSEALFHHLDRDRDGKLSAAELADAPRLLNRLDENEDEVLTPAEIMNGAPLKNFGPISKMWPEASRAEPLAIPEAVLRVDLHRDGKAEIESPAKSDYRRTLDKTGPLRFSVPGGVATVEVSTVDPLAGARETREFLLAQLRSAVGPKGSLAKEDAEQDASLRGLVGLYEPADLNGDGKLTVAEVTAFLDLVEQGVGCQVMIVIADRGRSLFENLDANGDGKLDRDELRRAGKVVPEKLPRALQLTVSRGPIGPTFGPIPVALPAKFAKPNATAKPTGPAWFQAMDHNGDGFLSPSEFLGPPELFRQYDANGDGRIDASEAEAQRRTSK